MYNLNYQLKVLWVDCSDIFDAELSEGDGMGSHINYLLLNLLDVEKWESLELFGLIGFARLLLLYHRYKMISIGQCRSLLEVVYVFHLVVGVVE
jgi:hypothetical protein